MHSSRYIRKKVYVSKEGLIMSSISTITSSTSRITGLASGLDTDELVKDLTATTRSKIEKVEQQKQILEWKQEDYRSTLEKLVEFNDTYFGSSSSSITLGDKLNQITASSSNTAYVQAVASDNATKGSVYISDIVSMATSASVKSSSSVSPDLSFTVSTDNLSSLSGAVMKITLDGTTKTITFSDSTYGTVDDVATELSNLLDNAFGEGRITVSNSSGDLCLSVENSILKIANTDDTTATQALDILGFSADTDVSSNRLDLSKTISDYATIFGNDESFSFTINDTDFTFDSSTTLSKVISTINASDANVTVSYSKISDTFMIKSNETGTGSNVTVADTTGSFLSAILGGSGTATAGTNAVVKLSLDGSTAAEDQITITRNSNTFEIAGTTYTLKGMASGTVEEGVTVNTSLDTDAIYDTITKFVSDYNELLGSITDKLYEERDGDFQPLTDSEKEDLSDDEVADWTEQARKGWLRNDTYLTNIYNSLRNSLYTQVKSLDGSGDNIGVILADIGITTSDYTNYGKLTINEDKLKSALVKDASSVINLLTQESTVGYSLYNSSEDKETRYNESGLLWRINDIVKGNISSIGKKGALVGLVGNPSTGYTGTFTYSERINAMKDTIDELNDKLSDEEDYYYSKFTAMETSLNSLNTQSSYLSSLISS